MVASPEVYRPVYGMLVNTPAVVRLESVFALLLMLHTVPFSSVTDWKK